MQVKASLKYTRVGTQKARLVADSIRGKNINEALRILSFMPKKSAPLFKKLLESAVANAEEKKMIDVDMLYVKEVMVDQGPSLKRYKPAPQGRAKPIRKKMSHFHVVLSEKLKNELKKTKSGSHKKKVTSEVKQKSSKTKKQAQKQAQTGEKQKKVVAKNNEGVKKKTSQKKGEDGTKS